MKFDPHKARASRDWKRKHPGAAQAVVASKPRSQRAQPAVEAPPATAVEAPSEDDARARFGKRRIENNHSRYLEPSDDDAAAEAAADGTATTPAQDKDTAELLELVQAAQDTTLELPSSASAVSSDFRFSTERATSDFFDGTDRARGAVDQLFAVDWRAIERMLSMRAVPDMLDDPEADIERARPVFVFEPLTAWAAPSERSRSPARDGPKRQSAAGRAVHAPSEKTSLAQTNASAGSAPKISRGTSAAPELLASAAPAVVADLDIDELLDLSPGDSKTTPASQQPKPSSVKPQRPQMRSTRPPPAPNATQAAQKPKAVLPKNSKAPAQDESIENWLDDILS
ncbi:hypothetical protein HK105_208874 [Polyrhizophydium stewartii]|uniref:Uncharacterized protein n=1 Tax=Polyrhizophydium stewartii TaxID=2732419 RepID=A0ABR4MWM6_9FUNG|nr:hypothetical protein HK105_006855 [Polyrhizophydium stewartii]